VFFALKKLIACKSFNSIRSLALRAVALEFNKAIFFRGIPLGYMKLYSSK
jgi:hypothetical protein